MSTPTVSYDEFREALVNLLDETFEPSEGPHFYLDTNDDFRSTLESITAEEASQLTGSSGNSIASQLRHVNYHIEVGIGYMTGNPPQDVDWGKAWEQTAVTAEEWQQLQDDFWRLKDEMYTTLRQDPPQFGVEAIAGGIGWAMHLAFHLGQIRHARCFTPAPNAPGSVH